MCTCEGPFVDQKFYYWDLTICILAAFDRDGEFY